MAERDELIQCSQSDSTLIVRVIPSQLRSMEVVQSLKDAILKNATASGVTNVILDLQDVQFAGSVAFLAFLGIRRLDNVKRVVVCGMSPMVRDLFLICKLISLDGKSSAPFEGADDVEAAKKLLSKAA